VVCRRITAKGEEQENEAQRKGQGSELAKIAAFAYTDPFWKPFHAPNASNHLHSLLFHPNLPLESWAFTVVSDVIYISSI
jgi:hypothetical protein